MSLSAIVMTKMVAVGMEVGVKATGER